MPNAFVAHDDRQPPCRKRVLDRACARASSSPAWYAAAATPASLKRGRRRAPRSCASPRRRSPRRSPTMEPGASALLRSLRRRAGRRGGGSGGRSPRRTRAGCRSASCWTMSSRTSGVAVAVKRRGHAPARPSASQRRPPREAPVVGAEVVSPLRYAVGLVHRDERDAAASASARGSAGSEPLGRDVEQRRARRARRRRARLARSSARRRSVIAAARMPRRGARRPGPSSAR